MCNDVSYLTKKAKAYAQQFGKGDESTKKIEGKITKLKNSVSEAYHVNSWSHPNLPIITSLGDFNIETAEWGYIPHWVNTKKEAYLPKSNYSNARGETLFESKAFRQSAVEARCLIMIDGYYDHYHHPNKYKYPYYITLSNNKFMTIAGVMRTATFVDQDTGEEITKNTVTMVTTLANSKLAKIHNNPTMLKRGYGSRMLAVIPEDKRDNWLYSKEMDIIKGLITTYDQNSMQAYPVKRPLLGPTGTGNTPEAIKKVDYPELVSVQGSLF